MTEAHNFRPGVNLTPTQAAELAALTAEEEAERERLFFTFKIAGVLLLSALLIVALVQFGHWLVVLWKASLLVRVGCSTLAHLIVGSQLLAWQVARKPHLFTVNGKFSNAVALMVLVGWPLMLIAYAVELALRPARRRYDAAVTVE
jgi:hypothetical protein